MAVGISLGGLNRNAVFAQKIDNRVGSGLPVFDRHEKNVVAAVGVFLGQDADVGDENET